MCGVRKLVREVGDLWYSKTLCVESGVRKLVISKLVTRQVFQASCAPIPRLMYCFPVTRRGGDPLLAWRRSSCASNK